MGERLHLDAVREAAVDANDLGVLLRVGHDHRRPVSDGLLVNGAVLLGAGLHGLVGQRAWG